MDVCTVCELKKLHDDFDLVRSASSATTSFEVFSLSHIKSSDLRAKFCTAPRRRTHRACSLPSPTLTHSRGVMLHVSYNHNGLISGNPREHFYQEKVLKKNKLYAIVVPEKSPEPFSIKNLSVLALTALEDKEFPSLALTPSPCVTYEVLQTRNALNKKATGNEKKKRMDFSME